MLSIFARTFCTLCERRICNKNNSLLCISCSESFHKKCLKLTSKTFNKYHVCKNFLCVYCAFKNLPFYQSSDSSDYYSTGQKSNFPSNNCNSLEIISNTEGDIFKINPKYFTIKEFLNLDLNDNSLSLFHVNIASLDKYLDIWIIARYHKASNSGYWNIWTQNQKGFLSEWFTTWLYFWIWTNDLYSWRRWIFH